MHSCKLRQWMPMLRFNLLDEEDIQLWKCLPQQGDWYLKWQRKITNLLFLSTKCLYDNSYSLLHFVVFSSFLIKVLQLYMQVIFPYTLYSHPPTMITIINYKSWLIQKKLFLSLFLPISPFCRLPNGAVSMISYTLKEKQHNISIKKWFH